MNIVTINKIPKDELTSRMTRFLAAMDSKYPDWELCVVTGAMSMYYLTGTICDGLLQINRSGNSVLWVRRSYERAVLESAFSDIHPMKSFRDIAGNLTDTPDTLYLDMACATMEWYALLGKYIQFSSVLPIDKVMLNVRAVKSEYELSLMRRAGSTADRLLREEFPSLLRDGISEAELGAQLLALFIKNGHHGVSRFTMRNSDMILGHVSFGDSPLYPSVFNGASGVAGLCPAAPVIGSPVRFLQPGDLIYADICFGIEGYNIDKTLVFSYKTQQPGQVLDAHSHCLELARKTAKMLRPGAKPSDIYKEVSESVRPEFKHCFMGTPGRTVPFLGHGVGLYVDELPVLAKGFDEPLELGMTIAIEPKMGLVGIGMVGSENTFLVTESGGESLTGSIADIILC